MSRATKADDFLQNMREEEPTAVTPPPVEVTPREVKAKAKPMPTRSGLKHIGGYLDRETVEKVALLRARLGLDNSELIKLAIDDLHRKQMAKRAFGDA
jgi:hypothetical protein